MPTVISPKITDAGLDAAVNAANDGIQLQITHVVLGQGQYTPANTAVGLISRKEKVTISGAVENGVGSFMVSAYLPSYTAGAPYNVGEIGFYAGDPDAGGVLFAVYSAPGTTIFQRNSLDWVGQFSVKLTRVPAGSVTISVDPGGALALAVMAQHLANPHPHTQYIRHFRTAVALPTVDEGPIWSEAFNSLMTWQSFTANGANRIGYASVGVGNIIAERQPTPRIGRVRIASATLSKTTGLTSTLWHWALHNGLVVPLGAWQPGTLFYADNGDGTFRVPDIRGDWDRYWSDGSNVDAGRLFGTWQNFDLQSHAHIYWASENSSDQSAPDVERRTGWRETGYTTSYTGGGETRTRNTAPLGVIQV